METSSLVEKAIDFALLVHTDQKYGNEPYFIHLDAVHEEVIRFKHLCPCALDVMEACAYLHDTVEDGKPNGKDMYKILVKEFTTHHADIVYNVTNELGRNRQEQNTKTYPKIAVSIEGKFLKLCDRIANVRNAIREGSRMLDVYREEQEKFEAVVRTYGEYDEMWDELNSLLNLVD